MPSNIEKDVQPSNLREGAEVNVRGDRRLVLQVLVPPPHVRIAEEMPVTPYTAGSRFHVRPRRPDFKRLNAEP